jgi:hypothetical protein
MSLMRWYLTGVAMTIAMGGTWLQTGAQQIQPLTNVEDFDIDYDWFRPLYAEDFDGRSVGKTGFYFTYDRMYMNVSRRREAIDRLTYEIQPAYSDGGLFFGGGPRPGRMSGEEMTDYTGDWTYGNRFELGYMTEKNRGWMFTAWKMDNPSAIRTEDNIRRNEEAATDDNTDSEIVNRPNFENFGTIEIPRVEQSNVDRALDLLHEPIGDTFITLNGVNYYSFDLSRVWRLEQFHSGMLMDIFAGPKYVRIRDHSDRADYVMDPSLLAAVPIGDGTFNHADYDAYVTEFVYTDNDMFGGQFGCRNQWRRGRWLISSDVRGMLFNNFRSRERNVTAEISARDFAYTIADGGVTIAATDTVAIDFRQNSFHDDSQRFVYGGEFRLEGAFELTHYVSIRGGLQVLAFADGVGRGVYGTDESFTAGGVTMGLTINR